MEEMKYITFLNLIAKALFTGLVFVVIREKSDYYLQPVLIALGYIVSGVLAMVIIRLKYRIRLRAVSLRAILSTLKESSNMFITLFLPNLYSNFSIILLNIYSGKIATGLYSSGFKFIEITNQLSEVLSRTFYPFLARRLDRHRTYVLINLLVSSVAGISLYFLSDLLVSLFYTGEFAESARVIRIMAIGPVFLFMMNSFGPNYLVLLGKDRILRNIVIVCSGMGFVLSWIMVPAYSYMGAALTITFTWGVRGLVTWLYASRERQAKLELQKV